MPLPLPRPPPQPLPLHPRLPPPPPRPLIRAIAASSAPWLCVLLVLLGASAPASAQQAPADKADILFREGREAMKRGDAAAACPKFAESQRLDPAPGTLINLSECEEALGKLTDAWRHIQQAAQQLPDGDDRLPIVREQAETLDRRIPRLTVRLRPHAPASSTIVLDGQERVTPGTTIVVDPGSHVVATSAPGWRTHMATIRVAESERAQLLVAPEPLPAERPAPQPGSARKAWGWTLGGIGVAGLVTAGVSALVLNHKQTTVFAHCQDKLCDQQGYDAARAGRSLEPLFYGALVVGGLGLGVGSALLITAPDKPRTTVTASVLPGGAALSVSGGLW